MNGESANKPNTLPLLNLPSWVNPFPGCISGSTLKLVAVISMSIDHFAAGVFYYMVVYGLTPESMSFDQCSEIYNTLRDIGRAAFPIYCFLLIEGLIFTRSRPRYLLRLSVFALISEFPFDLALNYDLFPYLLEDGFAGFLEAPEVVFSSQNVFFTLAIGLAGCILIEEARSRFGVDIRTALIAFPTCILAYYLAEWMKTDYGGAGVALIFVMYFLHSIRIAVAGAGYFILTRLYDELWSIVGLILTLFYNGKRGFVGRTKFATYFFYAFYPAHLIIYFLWRTWLFR